MRAIEFDEVTFCFEQTSCALDHLSLLVDEGEFLCVLGANGSGKSTLARHVNALLAPQSGVVRIFGHDAAQEGALAVRPLVGMVFQNPDDQLVASLVEDDVAFGPGNLGIPEEELRERVTVALDRVGLQGFEKREIDTLSGGQKQLVALAGALAMQPRVLVLDEADSMLDPKGRAQLMCMCEQLHADGLTIVYITHFAEAAVHADRVIVLENGRIALDGPPELVFAKQAALANLCVEAPFAMRMSHALQTRGIPVIGHVVREALEAELVERLVGSVPSGGDCIKTPSLKSAGVSSKQEPPAICFEGVSFSYASNSAAQRRKPHDVSDGKMEWALCGVSFSVEQHDIVGIVGHTGSGKSTLAQLCNGLLQPTQGRILVEDTPLSRTSAASVRRDVGLVFQFPERQLFASTVYDDIAFGPRNLGLSEQEVRERVIWAMRCMSLDEEGLFDSSPFALSGGEQRRVAIAGVLAMKPKTMVLDEPTSGLDPQARQLCTALISELNAVHGMSIVVISHDMDAVARLCNRVVVLDRGRIIVQGSPAEVFADEAGLRAIGLAVPQTVRLANALGIGGFGNTVPSEEELADCIAAACV